MIYPSKCATNNRVSYCAMLMFLAAIVFSTFAVTITCAQDGASDAPEREAVPPEPKLPEIESDVPPTRETTPVPLGNTSELPWNKRRHPDVLPIRALQHAREQLDILRIDDSHLRQLVDGQPLDAQNETLVKVLFQLPRFEIADLERWKQAETDWSDVIAEPAKFRVDVMQLAGRVTSVQRKELLPETVELFQFPHYYQVTLRLDDSDQEAIVCTRHIPSQWEEGVTSEHRASAVAMFLQTGETQDATTPLYFAAKRVAWHPGADDPLANSRFALLGGLGVDVGLIEKIPNYKSLVADDREIFYQFLQASTKAEASPGFTAIKNTVDLPALIAKPGEHHGEVVTLRGTARRVTYVVADEDIQQRYGFKGYYQIDGFLPLGDTKIRLVKVKGEEEAPEYSERYPCTLCVLELPKNLQEIVDDLSSSESQMEVLNEEIVLKGFFYKLWSYRSQYMQQFGERQRQPAPLFIGVEPQLITQSTSQNALLGYIGGGLFVVALGVIWFGLWRYSRGDKEFDESKLKKNFQVPQGKSLNDMGIESQDGPDFTGLD